MRMVLVPAPVIYPNIPIAPVEPLLPAHPLPVAQTQSLNTHVHEPSPQIIDLASSTHSVSHCPATPSNSPATTPAQPDKKKGPVYAPIATLDHAQSPTPSSLQVDTMDASNQLSDRVETPDESFPSSILITDVRTLSTPHTISGVDEHRDLNTTAIQLQESAPNTQDIDSREEPRCSSSLGSSPAISVEPLLQPTPSPEPEMSSHSTPTVSTGLNATSTTPLGRVMSPVVILHRSPVLDAINDERNFREIERKMEEIHNDS